MRRGFSLIEALTVVAIIGVLASLTTYVIVQAQRQARDAARRSDLTTIAVAFQARFEAQTCQLAARGRYPGYTNNENASDWQVVTSLQDYSDSCGAFTEFLTSLPSDPSGDRGSPYKFNLSSENGLVGKHFRLAAKLEQTPNQRKLEANQRQSHIWVETFGGVAFEPTYNYFLGN
jgi:prepilin-type N-terminal cleavage/methylation domain-containing protein